MSRGFGNRLLPALLGGLLAVLAAAADAQTQPPPSADVFATKCLTDDEVPAADRSAIEAVSLGYVRAIFGSDPAAAYDSFSAAAKRSVSREEFAARIGPMIRSLASFSDLHVTHRYRLVVTGGSGYEKALCPERAGQKADVSVSVEANATQAYVELEAEMKDTGWAGVAWLVLEDGAWRVQHFQIVNVARIAGKPAAAFSDMAREERRRGHDFNAYVLDIAALQLADRGPNFELPLQGEIEKERLALPTPPEFAGKPPFLWRYAGASFSVLKVGPIAIDGKLYLVISQRVPPWKDEQEAGRRNRALADAFARAHPDYKDAFAGLVIDASEEGGHGHFRTVVAAR